MRRCPDPPYAPGRCRVGARSPSKPGDVLRPAHLGHVQGPAGGQILGPTFDYTHGSRFRAGCRAWPRSRRRARRRRPPAACHELFAREDLIRPSPTPAKPRDLTREPLDFPADGRCGCSADPRRRGLRASMAYSTHAQRAQPPVRGELRIETCRSRWKSPSWRHRDRRGGADRCETVNQFTRLEDERRSSRAATASSSADRAQGDLHGLGRSRAEWEELGEDDAGAPAQDVEFVLYHADNVQSDGFWSTSSCPITSISVGAGADPAAQGRAAGAAPREAANDPVAQRDFGTPRRGSSGAGPGGDACGGRCSARPVAPENDPDGDRDDPHHHGGQRREPPRLPTAPRFPPRWPMSDYNFAYLDEQTSG